MSISIVREELISIRQVAAMVPGYVSGKAVDPSTVYRWCTRGLQGVRLERVKVGGRYLTSVQAVERFVAALNSGDDSTTPPNTTLRSRRAAAERAGRDLDQLL